MTLARDAATGENHVVPVARKRPVARRRIDLPTGLGTAVGNEECHRGVRITNVYPGEVETPILENRPNPVSDEHRARILQPEDIAPLVWTIANLPARAHVPEIVVKPTVQEYY